MATTKEKSEAAVTKRTKSAEVEDELNLDARVTVKNLADWTVTFTRLHDGVGDVLIAANGEQRLSRNEIQAQINNGNRLFSGTDGNGSHASIYIADEDTRKWLGFESDGKPQVILTDEIVKKLFALSDSKFKSALPETIQTRAEKKGLVEAIRRLNINDYRKIVIVSEYTGYKV